MARCWTGPPKVPTFNLTCNIWFGAAPGPPIGLPNLAAVPCQLQLGERVPVQSNQLFCEYILLPKLTDVAATPRALLLPNADIVECPAGSLRYYVVMMVDDVGKGFANEYRQAMVQHAAGWPVPTP